MKVRHAFIGLGAVIIGGFLYFAPTSAVTYSTEEDVKFTFNPQIDVNIDSADIEILDLAPGTRKDSNIVSITVGTNSIAGYNISATVGNTTYNNTNMNHITTNDVFTSLSTDADVATITTANTWGYSISEDGTSWSNFSGLPVYTETAKQILNTEAPSVDNTRFKINAYASDSQTAGDYRNVINFIVVANVPPRDWPDVVPGRDPIIQSIDESVCDLVEVFDSQFKVKDIRDGKYYWISKLRDGHCWMTQNLDLDLDSTVALTSATTDLGWNGSEYETLSWTPSNSTLSYEESRNVYTSSSEPYSMDPGDWYWYKDPNDQYSVDYMSDSYSGTAFSNSKHDENGTHGHIGNYYNFVAAVAENTTPQDGAHMNTICPKNWTLPISGQDKTMFSNYSNVIVDGESNAFYDNSIEATTINAPFYGVRAGYISGTYLSSANYNGYYWNSVKKNGSGVSYYYSYYDFNSQYNMSMGYALSVRCLVRHTPQITLVYNSNDENNITKTQKMDYDQDIKLAKNTFTRSGYDFNGWNTSASGTGGGYGDEADYHIDDDISVTKATFYAQWKEPDSGSGSGGGDENPTGPAGKTLQDAYEIAYIQNNNGAGLYYDTNANRYKHGLYVPEKDSVTGEYTGNYFEATVESDYIGIPANDLRFAIQDIDMTIYADEKTYSVCSYATVIGSNAYVLDLRDFKSYWITKMKDGSCWMTQNLDLDLKSNKTLTPNDTDIRSNWTPPSSTIYVAPGTDFLERYAAVSLSEDGLTPSSVDVGNWYIINGDVQSIHYCYQLNCDYTVGRADNVFFTTPQKGNGAHGHVGNYYNWTAAVAESDSSEHHYDGQADENRIYNPTTSICPKGWRLPTASSNSALDEYRALKSSYDGNYNEYRRALYSDPIYFVMGGSLPHSSHIASLSGQAANIGAGMDAEYWTTSDYTSLNPNTGEYSYNNIYSSIESSGGRYAYRSSLFPIRCKAR